MLIGMWRKFRSRPDEPALPATPAGVEPFKPSYTPMHGPGAKPLEKPVTGWHPGTRQKVLIASVLALVLGSGGFFISNLGGGTSSASPESVSFGNRSDSDESAVLGADDYTVPNSPETGNTANPTPTPGTGSITSPRGTSPLTQPVIPRPIVNQPKPANPPTPSPSPAPSPPPVVPPTPTPAPQPKTYTVTYTAAGFNQATLAIKKGDTVRFVHGGNQEAFQPGCQNSGILNCLAPALLTSGGSWERVFDEAGSFVIHNSQNTAQTMTITVTE